ncbi:ATP-grasp domain-containing protein [Streptomyces fragilis]|uniref:ATP-grasp domain-containing protein n=1 Tax=Streptomyces fragilis TaxID=67301 RepID=A0ABV2YC82_9ACTN|nr:ATP-grasp domain-containing protein [Streptomyces fragilis]
MSDRPVILLVAPTGAESEGYRGYCLRSVAAAYDVVLITQEEPSWEVPYIRDCVVVPDLTDQTQLNLAGQALAERWNLAGALTWTEWYLVPVTRLAHHLGLPANPVEAVRACRDKAVSRALFDQHQVPSAISRSVRTLQEAQAVAEEIGFPVVLKPTAHAASVGVIRADDADQLTTAYRHASAAAAHGRESTDVLVEEYLDGPEISVECATQHGSTTVVAVTRKTVGMPPHFEELAHSVDASDTLRETVAPVARAAIDALGVTDGVSHVEMRLVDGHPRLVEVNGRLGGDMIGHLVRLATGIDLARAAADIACGRIPDLTPTRASAAAVKLLYPPTSGTLTRLRFHGAQPWLDTVHFQRRTGDEVLLPADGGDTFTARLGYLVTTASTGAQARDRAEDAARGLTVHVRPRTGTAWREATA